MDPKVVRNNYWRKMKKLSQSFYDTALKGDLPLLKDLKSIGAQFCKVGPNKMNPLHAASMNGHYDIVKFLTEAGVDINEKAKDGKTALHIAVIHERTQIADLLVKAGASIDCFDKARMTPLLYACDKKNSQLIRILKPQENLTAATREFQDCTPDFPSCLDSPILNEGGYLNTDGLPFSEDIDNRTKCNDPFVAENGLIAGLNDGPRISDIKNKNGEENYNKATFTSYQDIVASFEEEDRNFEERQNSMLQTLDELEKEDIESLELDEEDSSQALADLMNIQATLMTKEDASLLLLRLMGQGRTIELTEAGRRAFDMVKPKWIYKSAEEEEAEEDPEKPKKISSALVLHRNTSTTSTEYLQELSHSLNNLSSPIQYSPRLGSSPPLKRCRAF